MKHSVCSSKPIVRSLSDTLRSDPVCGLCPVPAFFARASAPFKVVEGHQAGEPVVRTDIVIEFDAKAVLVERGFVPNVGVTKDVQRIIETPEQKTAARSRKVGGRNGKRKLLGQL